MPFLLGLSHLYHLIERYERNRKEILPAQNRAFSLDKPSIIHYNISAIGVWRSLVSRMVRVHEAAGSNPATPTMASVLIAFERL